MTLPEIKSKVEITAIAEHLGIAIEKKSQRAKCPFHNDKTPSLQFSKAKQIATCFSSNCNAGTMDVIALTEKKLNINTHEALNYLKEHIGAVGALTPKTKPISTKENYGKVFEKLKANFKKSKKAMQYVEMRHLDIGKFSLFEVGYNGGGSYGNLKYCIVFALRDRDGNVASLYGRSIASTSNSKHFYTANRKGLYPGYPETKTKTVILTESIIDTATLAQHHSTLKIKHSKLLSLYGTNGLNSEHIAALQSLEDLEEIILFFDGDEAGKAAVEKQGKYLNELFPEIKISGIDTPENEDVNSLLDGHDASIYKELMENRIFLFSEEKRSTENRKEESTAVERAKLNTENKEQIIYQKGFLKYSILGGINLMNLDRMRVTLKVNVEPQLNPSQSLRHNLDLYNDDQLEKLVRKAAHKLEISTREVNESLAELVELLEAYRLSQRKETERKKPKRRILTEASKNKALEYLKSPDLLKRTNRDIGKSGVIGEQVNRLLMYLVFTSRKREHPLHIMSLGASGTGKTYLQEKIAELIPKEEVKELTGMSDNALYYFGKKELQHKLVLIEDLDAVENSLLILRELMSKERISKDVALKNKQGTTHTQHLEVEGPICLAGTTTKEKLYEDNANRSLLIYRDMSKAHQEKVMDYQRKLSAGKVNKKEEESIKESFKDMQVLLRPVKVINPFAEALKIPNEVFKPLRSNHHYLQFIECVTFYHQYQRAVKKDANGEEYIESSLEDIAAANYLLKEVLLAKADELSGACRKFFERLKNHLARGNKRSFYAKELRANLRMNHATLHRHLKMLLRNNYLRIVGGDKYRKGYEYEVVNQVEYNELKGKISTALDAALEQIKHKEYLSISAVSQNENELLNPSTVVG